MTEPTTNTATRCALMWCGEPVNTEGRYCVTHSTLDAYPSPAHFLDEYTAHPLTERDALAAYLTQGALSLLGLVSVAWQFGENELMQGMADNARTFLGWPRCSTCGDWQTTPDNLDESGACPACVEWCECPNCDDPANGGECRRGFCVECSAELGRDAKYPETCDDCGFLTACRGCGELSVPIDSEGFAPDYCAGCADLDESEPCRLGHFDCARRPGGPCSNERDPLDD